jgi:hypothetical protein
MDSLPIFGEFFRHELPHADAPMSVLAWGSTLRI